MNTLIRKTPVRPHAHAAPVNPLYGYGYNPAQPSILAVAHDEVNGGRVFVFTDRPCALVGPTSPAALPLSFPADPSLVVVGAVEMLPAKFRLWLSRPVPAGTAWAWAANGFGLIDPITGNPLNAGGGSCADVPGPFAPLPPAAVVATSVSGTTAVLTFDRPVTADGNPPDDAITFNGMTPTGAANADAYTISFALPGFAMAGDPWVISRQPAYLATPVLWPASGSL